MLPPRVAANTQPVVQVQQQDGTWKSFEQPCITGTNTEGRWNLYPLLFCRSDHPAANAGSAEMKLRDCLGPPNDPSISGGSSFSVSIPAPDQGRS
jgi:hypothetical protein